MNREELIKSATTLLAALHAFATGYGERAPIPETLAAAPVIQKPYTNEVVQAALGRLR